MRDSTILVGAALSFGCSRTSEAVGDAGSGETAPLVDADAGADARADCAATAGEPSCPTEALQPFDAARSCFGAPIAVSGFCVHCTIPFPSASLGPICAVDPTGRLFVVMTRPDVAFTGEGWHFGHRRDRSVYTDLEPDTLTPGEAAACDAAIALVGLSVSPPLPSCGSDAGVDATLDAGPD